MKTMIYIDGFNLYYGSLKDTPYKWLNIQKMCELLLPSDEIVGIKYFTAHVHSRQNDPNKNIRQQVYLRALKTLSNFEIILGHYSEHIKPMRLANPQPGQPHFVDVIKTEEKGSDVNIAVHLLNDGFRQKYELGVLITNDSDLLSAVEIVQSDLNLKVGIVNPQKHPSRELKNEALFIKKIRSGVLKLSQFPHTMTDNRGTFHKPANW